MDKIIENLLTEFVTRVSEKFKLDFEDALAAVSQTKIANDLAAKGNHDNRSAEELCAELFDEISKGW